MAFDCLLVTLAAPLSKERIVCCNREAFALSVSSSSSSATSVRFASVAQRLWAARCPSTLAAGDAASLILNRLSQTLSL